MRECESATEVTSSSYLSESEVGSESPVDSPARTERPQTEVGQQPQLAGRKVWASSGLMGPLGDADKVSSGLTLQ